MDLMKGNRSHSQPQCPKITSVNIHISYVNILMYFLSSFSIYIYIELYKNSTLFLQCWYNIAFIILYIYYFPYLIGTNYVKNKYS